MTRKSKTPVDENFGGELPIDTPSLSTDHDSILMVERLIQSLLRSTIERLSAKASEEFLIYFFSHFFEPTAGLAEVTEFVANFQKQPPKAILGYPRSTASFPCFAIIMESEQEETKFVGDFIGETHEEDDAKYAAEYVGAFYNSTYGIYIYAEHPDVCAYLYQFAKATMHASKGFLFTCGIHDMSLSGGELAPDETYIPENMFLRVLRAQISAPLTIPRFLSPDPGKVRITGIFRPDVVVDGMPSGVREYVHGETDD